MIFRSVILVAVLLTVAQVAPGQTPAEAAPTGGMTLPDIQSPQGVSVALKWLLMVTVLSVAPAIVVMMTCFTRIVVVLGLLRQALATNQLPPNQILFGLALLMTLVVMAPVYKDVHRDATGPYLAGQLDGAKAIAAGEKHVKSFMIRQIQSAGNEQEIYLFIDKELAGKEKLIWKDVPTTSLIPAFVVSELKVAFIIGFRIFLPFVIVDMLVASVLVSMGVLMLPPVVISMPFKLLLFVLADGWHLVVGTLMNSFS